MPRIIPYTTQEEWLALRRQDVTSTEAAALFGLSPYLTRYELWHRKRMPGLDAFQATERMKWGNRLESAIAEGVAEDQGWTVAALKVYAQHIAQPGMGSSFDYEIIGPISTDAAGHPHRDDQPCVTCDGPGILEIKNVDGWIFRDSWVVGDTGELEAPAHIEIQVQHQLEVMDREWAAIVALVGGNEPRILIRTRDRAVGNILRAQIATFWEQVRDNVEPAPEFGRDARFISKLYGFAEPGKVLEPTESEARAHLLDLLKAYTATSAAIKGLEEEKDAVKAEILTLIQDAERVIVPGYSISAGVVAEAEVSYMRKACRNLRITKQKERVQ